MNSFAHMDIWSWETFLEPLPSDGTAEGPYIFHIVSSNDDANLPLVVRFSRQLAIQHDEKSAQKESKVCEAKAALTGLLVIDCEAQFEKLERRWKRYEAALNMKSDREMSGSMWTIAKLECYISSKDIAFVQLESSFDLTGEALQKICDRVDLAMKAVCGPEGTVENLNELHSQPNSTECNTRMILDAILQPLCVYKGLTLRSEQTIKSHDLPTNRYDYIMYFNA